MEQFKRFSADLGQDETLVQGAGGNTSLKDGDVIWVKASGMWLADAMRKDIFLPLSLARLNEELERPRIDEAALRALAPGGGLQPSIETALHGLLPHKVVAHVHSVRAIAWAARIDAEQQLSERLDGLAWSFAPYRRPGTPLAEALRDLISSGGAPSVVVLGNHGLIVAAEDVESARSLLTDVEARLARERRLPAAPPPEKEAPPPGYRWSDDAWASAPAFDDWALHIAASGSLYPDHVVFLGPSARVVDRASEAAAGGCTFAYVRSAGVLVAEDLTEGALAMLRCLGRVLLEIEPGAAVRYLSSADEGELLGWDMEALRMRLDRMRC